MLVVMDEKHEKLLGESSFKLCVIYVINKINIYRN